MGGEQAILQVQEFGFGELAHTVPAIKGLTWGWGVTPFVGPPGSSEGGGPGLERDLAISCTFHFPSIGQPISHR